MIPLEYSRTSTGHVMLCWTPPGSEVNDTVMLAGWDEPRAAGHVRGGRTACGFRGL